MAKRIEVRFSASLKGGHPSIDDWDEADARPPWPEAFSDALQQALEGQNPEAGTRLVKGHLAAHFYPHSNFEDHPDLFAGAPDEIAARQVTAGPLVEMQDGYPIFRRWGATFALSLPLAVLLRWTQHTEPVGDDPGCVEWSEDGYEEWALETGFWGFQDGVRWSLRGVAYTLDGVGEHSCEPDREQVVHAVWAHLASRPVPV